MSRTWRVSLPKWTSCWVGISLFTLPLTVTAKAVGPDFRVEILAENLGTVWSIEFPRSEEVLFSEKAGSLKVLNLSSKKISVISGGPRSIEYGQGGLLDVALHPEFPQNNRIFLSYTKQVAEGFTTAVAMGRLSVSGQKVEQLTDVFVANNSSRKSEHFGSRITFDSKGHMFFSVGDRGERNLAQDLSADQGKIHRLKEDGTVPQDNPFLGVKGARPTVWSYGHRNPQGLVYDSETQILWEQEHGPRGGDEINIIQRGKNYGWPLATYGKEYWGPKIGVTEKEGIEPPIHYYIPSIGPSGLEIYRGGKFPKWSPSLFSGALALTHLNRLQLGAKQKIVSEERLLVERNERVRDVRLGPDGLLYLSTDEGKIMRLVPLK